ncbi:TIGR02757 family protein [Hydrogenimonas sp. SS33]|uniref:TIGR02757 family protein n=1 Tax=Hydrogenimonas leucolamina TaxID=2954236 RepID=UPI00336C2CBC
MRERLEAEAAKRNDLDELSSGRPDPLMVARKLGDDRAVLLCALFGYGNAGNIVAFLESLDFSLLERGEGEIARRLQNSYYRFQNRDDVIQAFVTLSRVERGELKSLFLEGYHREGQVIDGVFGILHALYGRNGYRSRGYRFLFGTLPEDGRPKSPYKRWMMFLRWMVRKDALDLGRWPEVSRKDLVIPLDTHTFHVGLKTGLLRRKTYDWKAALELTEHLRGFDPEDPVRYDFALYRMGQEGVLGR